jgi:hypothetical protein
VALQQDCNSSRIAAGRQRREAQSPTSVLDPDGPILIRLECTTSGFHQPQREGTSHKALPGLFHSSKPSSILHSATRRTGASLLSATSSSVSFLYQCGGLLVFCLCKPGTCCCLSHPRPSPPGVALVAGLFFPSTRVLCPHPSLHALHPSPLEPCVLWFYAVLQPLRSISRMLAHPDPSVGRSTHSPCCHCHFHFHFTLDPSQ